MKYSSESTAIWPYDGDHKIAAYATGDPKYAQYNDLNASISVKTHDIHLIDQSIDLALKILSDT